MRWNVVCSLVLVFLSTTATPAREMGNLTPDRFSSLHQRIQPQPGEAPWATIPWLTRFDEARKQAAKEDKPLFVWRAGGDEVLGRA